MKPTIWNVLLWTVIDLGESLMVFVWQVLMELLARVAVILVWIVSGPLVVPVFVAESTIRLLVWVSNRSVRRRMPWAMK